MPHVLRLALLAICLTACQQMGPRPTAIAQPSALSQQHQLQLQHFMLGQYQVETHLQLLIMEVVMRWHNLNLHVFHQHQQKH